MLPRAVVVRQATDLCGLSASASRVGHWHRHRRYWKRSKNEDGGHGTDAPECHGHAVFRWMDGRWTAEGRRGELTNARSTVGVPLIFRVLTTGVRFYLFIYLPEGELLTGFAMRGDPNVAFG